MTEGHVAATPEQLAFAGEMTRAMEFRTGLRRFLRRTDEVCGAQGLDPRTYDLLLLVKAAGEGKDWPIAELSDRLALEEPVVTDLAESAEGAGLLERQQTHSGQAQRLRLTAAGNDRFQRVFASLYGERERLLNVFEQADADLRGLARSLELHQARDL